MSDEPPKPGPRKRATARIMDGSSVLRTIVKTFSADTSAADIAAWCAARLAESKTAGAPSTAKVELS